MVGGGYNTVAYAIHLALLLTHLTQVKESELKLSGWWTLQPREYYGGH